MSEASVFPAAAPPPRRVEPGLYLVATPIGNLRDVTLRALDVLAAADLVLAEDTRVTAKLLSAYGLKAKLERCDDHASGRAAELAIQRLNTALPTLSFNRLQVPAQQPAAAAAN